MNRLLDLENQIDELKKKIIKEENDLKNLENMLNKEREHYYVNSKKIKLKVLFHHIDYSEVIQKYKHTILISSVEIPKSFNNKIIEYHSTYSPEIFINYKKYKQIDKLMETLKNIISSLGNKKLLNDAILLNMMK